jgi:hypothetical protein
MLITLDIVNYNLGSCLMIGISILCPGLLGAMRSEYVDKAWDCEEMIVLQTLLHALISWIGSVACKTTGRLAFHLLYTIFPVDLQDIHEIVFT